VRGDQEREGEGSVAGSELEKTADDHPAQREKPDGHNGAHVLGRIGGVLSTGLFGAGSRLREGQPRVLLIDILAAGRGAKQMRSYLEKLTREIRVYVIWLTHAKERALQRRHGLLGRSSG
jgi:hypothetical protein